MCGCNGGNKNNRNLRSPVSNKAKLIANRTAANSKIVTSQAAKSARERILALRKNAIKNQNKKMF